IPAEAVLRNIAGNVTLVLFQIHAHYRNVTISFEQEPSPSNSGTGVDRGLISVLRPEQTVCTWYLRAVGANQVLSTAVSLPYTEKDPIPGGCNLEFDLEMDPNLYLDYNLAETHIIFAPANLGYVRGAHPPSCDSGTSLDSRWRLSYDVYQYFLPENDLLEATFVSHMRRMTEVPSIRAHGSKLYFSSLPGQGVIYNVIVRDPKWNTSAAYVPVHTYACSLSDLGDCPPKYFSPIWLFSVSLSVSSDTDSGKQVLLGGVLDSGVDLSPTLGLTAAAGIIGALLLVGYWWRFGLVIPCMLIVGVVLGSLVSSALFFTPVGDYRIFQDNTVFWVTFCCVALVIPVIFVCCPRVLNILTCGVVGSYTVVLATACYIYTSLSYIGIDLLRRILNEDFKRTYTSVPFQPNDIILLAVWTMLAIGGITVQLRRERHEAPFPPHPYRLWKRERERRVTNVLDPSHHVPPLRERVHNKLSQIKDLFQKEQVAGERTPLLL
ncbi:Transmembrane 7 superfamily member 3, partial [Ophiophagus hannah]